MSGRLFKASPKVCVLLATFNSSKYLHEQLYSIFDQTLPPTAVIISDDGSTDDTFAVINFFKKKHSNVEVVLLFNDGSPRGPAGNFAFLCEVALDRNDPYYLFCDHDDVWVKSKIEQCVHKIRELETQTPNNPVFVHSDLEVVNQDLGTISGSFAHYQGLLDIERTGLSMLLFKNVAVGCSVAFNKKLLLLASPIPRYAVMHDHWFAVCAKVFGQVAFLQSPLVRYRQHPGNSIGAFSPRDVWGFWPFRAYKIAVRYPVHVCHCIMQSRALLQKCEAFSTHVSNEGLSCLQRSANLPGANLWQRVKMQRELFGSSVGYAIVVFQLVILILLPLFFLYFERRRDVI